ncbi:hypothetical protein OPV22_029479 [Ensete ventricosum]|uniref:Cytokinin dehydrogenase 1 FAD/cytokinin binding domain-containing protein n=1 Tax=Ensete ventricosum TaxID=4639 RepID=A0AAV8Q191_ENSVE|nr:hypothetical protein OPV22_029479 [Ensete ventricosum]
MWPESSKTYCWINFEGLVLIYPLLRDQWDAYSWAVLPDGRGRAEEQVMYIVGVLRSANPATCAAQCLQDLLHHRRSLRPALGPVCGPQAAVRPPKHPSPGQGIFRRTYASSS